MRRALLGTVPATLALAVLAGASAPPPQKTGGAGPPADQLDYLFFASYRPVRIRMHARIGEKPYDAAWNDYMDQLFNWFDKDRNGSLSPVETARMPNAQALQQQIQGSIGGGIATVPFATLDSNKDGKVSKEEFRAYFRRSGFAALNLSNNNYQATQARQVNDSLLKRLDRNGDGKLSADEVAGMFDKLRPLDENEDEMLTEAELNTKASNGGTYAVAVTGITSAMAVPVVESGLVAVLPGAEVGAIQQIVTRYDRVKNGKLSRAEIGLDKTLFESLDRDRDGFLSPGELRAFLGGEPDLVFRLQLGMPAQGKGILSRIGLGNVLPVGPRAVVVNEKKLAAPWKKKLRRANADTLAFELGDARVSLQVNAAANAQVFRNNGTKDFYLREFTTLAGKKTFVERSQEKGANPYLFQIFSQADQNADGKLTRKELTAWLDLVGSGQNCSTSITVNDLGRGLFPILDANGDSRLSLREMKNAWARLQPLAKDGKSLNLAKVPRTMRIVVGQGNNTYYQGVPAAAYGGGPVGRPVPRGSTPTWFRKMDRNNDGDISPKEWLGTDEEFREIDTDGDGLISGDEAIGFEARKKNPAASAKR